MPKIKINEKDYTSPGLTSSANFSVAIPGFIATDKVDAFFSTYADENGICEISSVSDFEDWVGKVKPTETDAEGKYAEPTCFGYTEAEVPIWTRVFTQEEFYTTYAGLIYEGASLSGTPDPDVYVAKVQTSATSASTTTYGYYKLTKVTSTEFDTTKEYFVLPAGKEGYKTPTNLKYGNHYGNQMAYYLLSLGYTVLYVGIKRLAKSGDDENQHALNDSETFEPLRDKSLYDYRYLTSGMLADVTVTETVDDVETSTTVSMSAINNILWNIVRYVNDADPLTSGRGDCFVLSDIPKNNYIDSETGRAKTGTNLVTGLNNGVTIQSEYMAYFAPTVTYNFTDSTYSETSGTTLENLEFPAAFFYLDCASKAFQNYREWYAVAGYTRGLSNYAVAGLSAKIGDITLNKVQTRDEGNHGGINVITEIKGSYYLWGNRTSMVISTDLVAQNFLNIRQLCTTIKKDLYVKCRRFTFDPNSDTLWISFVNAISPLLEKMKGDQGIKEYSIVKKSTDKKATFAAVVRIVPVEAVEDFDLTITLEDSVSGTIVDLDE